MRATQVSNQGWSLHLFGNVQKVVRLELDVEVLHEQRNRGGTDIIFLKKDKKAHQDTLEVGGDLGRADIEVLGNRFDEGVYGELESVL